MHCLRADWEGLCKEDKGLTTLYSSSLVSLKVYVLLVNVFASITMRASARPPSPICPRSLCGLHSKYECREISIAESFNYT